MPAVLRIKFIGGPLFHTDSICLTAKCHNNFTKASENGLCILCIFFSPERTRERERWVHGIYYMKLTGTCFFLLSVASGLNEWKQIHKENMGQKLLNFFLFLVHV